VCIGSAIEFRSQLQPAITADEAGSYVTSLPSIVRFGDDLELWTMARQINRSLGRRMRLGQHLTTLWGMRFISPASLAKSPRVFGHIERKGFLNIGISNLGRYEFPRRIGEWALSGAQFITGVSISGYLIATVNTTHDELFWNFSYIDGAVSREDAENYADRCLQALLRAIA
jgi:hypothetical protein